MQLLQSLFGGGSGTNQGTAYVPPFVSPGGITPEQGALADFTAGEGEVGIANEFGTSGTGASTMETQAGGGTQFGKAQQEGGMSDINQEAMYSLYQNDLQTQLDQLAQNQAQAGTNATSLGNLVGSLFGTNQGNFTTGGTTTNG